MFGLFEPLLIASVIAFTLLGFLVLGGILHFSSRNPDGWLHIGVVGMLSVGAVGVATSGRSLTSTDMSLDAGSSAAFRLLIGPTSILVVMLAAERIASAAISISQGYKKVTPPGILFAYIVYWLGNYAAPGFFGEHPAVTQSGIYNLIIGIAFIFLSERAGNSAVVVAKNTIIAIVLASLFFAVTEPNLVLDTDYTQGFIPNLPRFAGLAPHAISFGFMIQIGMICLYAKPFKALTTNWIAWIFLASALFMTQAKSVWISLAISILYIAFTEYRVALKARLMDPTRPTAVIAMLFVALFGVLTVSLLLIFIDVQGGVDRFLASSEGAQLSSLTGRDQIWEAALNEWRRYPIFGYGLPAFDEVHRILIGISSATHGHNQIFDTLARSGLVGLCSLLFYVGVLLYWTSRYNAQTNGVGALFLIAIFGKSISEVPFITTGYGVDSLAQWLLIALICGAHRQLANRTQPLLPSAAPTPQGQAT